MMVVRMEIKSNMDLIDLRRRLLIALKSKRTIRLTIRMWQKKMPPT